MSRCCLFIKVFPPRLYGVPKVHKQVAPLRPIAAFSSSTNEIINREIAEKNYVVRQQKKTKTSTYASNL